jgi:hypothetical protein
MSNRDVSSSDLERARAFSRRLAGESSAPTPKEEKAGFTRFANRFEARAPRPESSPAVAPAQTPLAAKPSTYASWDALLAWCLEVTSSRAAFVVDPEGFVIAHCGDWKFENLEALGSQLLDVKERAERIEQGGNARLIALELESFSLNGMIFSLKDRGTMLVGFIDAKELGREVQKAIDAQVRHNVDHL